MAERRIADHADYRITLHAASVRPTERLIVTFGGQPTDLADRGFGTDYARSLGHDSLYVAQRHGTQYQGLSVEDFRRHVADLVEGRDVVAYGASLGAYAALYFGGSIDARIIAAAPMLPAWPPLRNPSYAAVELRHRDLTEVPRSRHAPVAIHDPMVPHDTRLIDEMVRPVYPDLRTLRLPFSGHKVLVALSRARQLTPLIGALIDRDELLDVTLPTDGSPIWHFQRGRYLRRIDPPTARIELERSLALAPAREVVMELLKVLIDLRDIPAAQALIDRVQDGADPSLAVIPSVAQIARRAGLRVPG